MTMMYLGVAGFGTLLLDLDDNAFEVYKHLIFDIITSFCH